MPGTRRIFAGVSGSPGSVHALRQAAQLAHHHDALLIPVLAWLPPDSCRLPWPELRQIWHDDAWQRLWDTLACGGCGAAGPAATARPTPTARCWPSFPSPWPGRQATACAAGRSGTAGPGQQPSPPREPATLPTGPSRAAGERTHRLSRARRGDWPSQQGGKWS
jgi:hypothetical protein